MNNNSNINIKKLAKQFRLSPREAEENYEIALDTASNIMRNPDEDLILKIFKDLVEEVSNINKNRGDKKIMTKRIFDENEIKEEVEVKKERKRDPMLEKIMSSDRKASELIKEMYDNGEMDEETMTSIPIMQKVDNTSKKKPYSYSEMDMERDEMMSPMEYEEWYNEACNKRHEMVEEKDKKDKDTNKQEKDSDKNDDKEDKDKEKDSDKKDSSNTKEKDDKKKKEERVDLKEGIDSVGYLVKSFDGLVASDIVGSLWDAMFDERNLGNEYFPSKDLYEKVVDLYYYLQEYEETFV